MNSLTRSSLRALLIDDNPDDRTLSRRALRREFPDLVAEEVRDAGELHRALMGPRFDIVITDYHLNWSDGLTLLPIIKETQPGCPIVMFTDSGSEQVAASALRLGVDDYILKKPREFRRLAESVRSSLEKARLRQRADSLDRKLNELLNGLEVGIYRITANGHLLYGNPAFYRILRIEPDPGKRSRKLPDLMENPRDLAEILREMRRSGRAHVQELPLRHLDGTPLWVSLTQVFRKSRNRYGIIDGMIEDITDKKRMSEVLLAKEAELRKAQKLESIGKLAGGVAHDFNNMLTAILGYSDLLLGAKPDLPPDRECLEEIRKAARRAASLTRELLAFGRKQMLFPKTVDMNRVLSQMEPLIRRTLGEGTELALALGNSPMGIKVDPVQLELVIMNLVNNAHDAMPSGGRLTIRTWRPGCEPEAGLPLFADSEPPSIAPSQTDSFTGLLISDTGFGMGGETQARIFEPFFTTKDEFHNSGLGLSTVYGIVNQSGGYILVDSRPGHGATFKVFFPTALDAPETGARTRIESGGRLENGSLLP